MREPVRDRGRLEHMLLAISNVEEFSKDVTYQGGVQCFALQTNSRQSITRVMLFFFLYMANYVCCMLIV